jgi:hypothetical protein
VTAPKPRALIAVDGVSAGAIAAAARTALGSNGSADGGISRWDASGVFQELAMAGESAGRPSARTLLLLYAADLVFRLRWEIRPAMEEGRRVVAAPYVDTAIAFGRAAGLPASWLTNLFRFAPAPRERRFAAADRGPGKTAQGFIEFSCEWMAGASDGPARRRIARGTAEHLSTVATRYRRRASRR